MLRWENCAPPPFFGQIRKKNLGGGVYNWDANIKHIGILNWLLPFEGWRWLKSLPSKFHLECCVVTSAPHTETADPPLQHFLLHTSREGAESTESRISLLKELKRESWRMNVKYKGRYSAIEYRMHAGKQLTHSGDDNHFTNQGIQHKTWDPPLMIQCHAMASKRRSALLFFWRFHSIYPFHSKPWKPGNPWVWLWAASVSIQELEECPGIPNVETQRLLISWGRQGSWQTAHSCCNKKAMAKHHFASLCNTLYTNCVFEMYITCIFPSSGGFFGNNMAGRAERQSSPVLADLKSSLRKHQM